MRYVHINMRRNIYADILCNNHIEAGCGTEKPKIYNNNINNNIALNHMNEIHRTFESILPDHGCRSVSCGFEYTHSGMIIIIIIPI